MSQRFMIFFGLLAASSSFAQELQPILDDGRTPRERIGVVSGVRSATDLAACSRKAMEKHLEASRLYSSLSLVKVVDRTFTASQYNQNLVRSVKSAWDLLIAQGDQDIARRGLCVGVYNWGEKNAFSHPEGYLFFDPEFITQFLSDELPTRTLLSLDQIIFHEFSHQLQFWYGNAFTADATVRRSELTVDCVASILNASLYRSKYGEAIWATTRSGVLEAVRAIGDLQKDDANHHGTPSERYQAAEIGLEIASSPLARFFSGKLMLQACEGRIRQAF